jgi:nucleotide-binding universal stress UspA family protein
MASTDNRFTIVVGIDFSETTDPTLDHAFELASRRGDADVHVLFVEDELTTPRVHAADPERATQTTEMLQRVQQRASDRLTEIAKRLTLKLNHVVAHVRRGSPAEHVVQLASHLDADLIIVGTHGRRGFERLLLGSVAERILRLARCPVLVVRPKDHEGVGKVPEIEPPCPDCVRARVESGSANLWCARHSEHHIRPHTYHYVSTGMYSSDRIATRSGETTPNQQH